MSFQSKWSWKENKKGHGLPHPSKLSYQSSTKSKSTIIIHQQRRETKTTTTTIDTVSTTPATSLSLSTAHHHHHCRRLHSPQVTLSLLLNQTLITKHCPLFVLSISSHSHMQILNTWICLNYPLIQRSSTINFLNTESDGYYFAMEAPFSNNWMVDITIWDLSNIFK